MSLQKARLAITRRCAHRPALRLYPVHHVRSHVLCSVVLVVLQTRHLSDERIRPAAICSPEFYQVDALHLPLINTLVLLLSGCAVTWAHHALVHENNRKDLINGLAIGHRSGHRLYRVCRPMNTGYLLLHDKTGNSAATSSFELLHGHRLPRLSRDHRDDLS